MKYEPNKNNKRGAEIEKYFLNLRMDGDAHTKAIHKTRQEVAYPIDKIANFTAEGFAIEAPLLIFLKRKKCLIASI